MNVDYPEAITGYIHAGNIRIFSAHIRGVYTLHGHLFLGFEVMEALAIVGLLWLWYSVRTPLFRTAGRLVHLFFMVTAALNPVHFGIATNYICILGIFDIDEYSSLAERE